MLRLKGYSIVKMRYRTKQGEIDIIARKGDLVAMVEVKVRKNVSEALDAVTHTAQRRIANAGDYWLAQQHDYAKLSLRYDIIAIVPRKWPYHAKDAW
jgi:putative endonuclease